MRTHLVALTLGPATLVSGLASYGLAHDKSHKEAWSDPIADAPLIAQNVTIDGMVPYYPDMQPHPVAARGAGPMIASLGNMTGARTLTQEEPSVGIGNASGAGAAGASASEAQRQGERLTDEKILHVTHVANAGEMDQARLAEMRAKDPRVREYAKMMLRMHADADRKEADVARRHSFTMVSSKTSDDLVRDDHSTMDMLKKKSGAEFDHAYIDAQIKNHEAVLDLIDTSLEPGANERVVKNLVRALRPTVQMHLDEARDIQSKLKE